MYQHDLLMEDEEASLSLCSVMFRMNERGLGLGYEILVLPEIECTGLYQSCLSACPFMLSSKENIQLNVFYSMISTDLADSDDLKL